MVSRDLSECLSLDTTRTEELPTSDWSPLQLSSYNLAGKPPPPPPPPVRQTETLERHPVRPSPALTTFTSGRTSAEPLETCRTNLRATPLPATLSELDLR